MTAGFSVVLAAVLTLHAQKEQGAIGSHRAVGAESSKSQPPAEQGHQIKVRSEDLFALQLEGCRCWP